MHKMVMINSGKNWEGNACEFSMDGNLHKNLSLIKDVVDNKDFDYVAVVAGLPGLGKSNFAIHCCKFLDPNFTIENICFTAEQFIEKTTNAEKNSAIILDESFASLNSKISMSSDFLRIINHLQIIRQKNLYVFLCLPNFFDLQKGVSIYRSSHLFVCYGQKFGHRGAFAAWGREEKKQLYINGLKYMNYHAQKPNFRGRFFKQKVIDQEEYDRRKLQHLQEQDRKDTGKTRASRQRDSVIYYVYKQYGLTPKQLCEITGISFSNMHYILNREKENDKEITQSN